MELVFYIFSPRGSNRVPNYRLPSESAAFFLIVVRYIIVVLLCYIKKKGIGKKDVIKNKFVRHFLVLGRSILFAARSQVVL